MKRKLSLLLSLVMLLSLLSACRGPAAGTEPPVSQEPAAGTDLPVSQWPSALDVVNTVFPFCGFGEGANLEYLSMDEGGSEFLTAYLENAYGLAAGTWEDAAVIRATGASAFEIAVLRMADSEAAVRAASALTSYIFSRQGDFAGYAPAEADMAAAGSINQDGPFAALFICPDTDGADAAFTAAVNGRTPAVPAAPSDEPVESAEPIEPVDDVDELLALLVEDCSGSDDISDLEWLDGSNPDELADYITNVYGLGREQWTEAAIARGKDGPVFEMAVLRMAEGQNGRDIQELVRALSVDYLDVKERGYDAASAQAELLHNAGVFSPDNTGFVILEVCGKSYYEIIETAERLLGAKSTIGFDRLLPRYLPPERIEFVPPNTDDMTLYDTAAIRAAWASDDPSGLSDYDRDIYDAAKQVLGRILKSDMSDLEKETAIYGWVVNNVNYDWTRQDIMAVTPRESFTPYGGLVNRAAVCLGYTTTFQLLCDLAGVECITVVGAAFNSTESHGWNMVRIKGRWYCVEVTWEANFRETGATKGQEQEWVYFNVTSDSMVRSDHQWDYANTPEAVTEGHGQG